jgi:hypothetical protein
MVIGWILLFAAPKIIIHLTVGVLTGVLTDSWESPMLGLLGPVFPAIIYRTQLETFSPPRRTK